MGSISTAVLPFSVTSGEQRFQSMSHTVTRSTHSHLFLLSDANFSKLLFGFLRLQGLEQSSRSLHEPSLSCIFNCPFRMADKCTHVTSSFKRRETEKEKVPFLTMHCSPPPSLFHSSQHSQVPRDGKSHFKASLFSHALFICSLIHFPTYT